MRDFIRKKQKMSVLKMAWLVGLILLLVSGSENQVLADENGGFAGAFLRIGLGARGLAMGNAQVATANYGFGSYYNPAALPFLPRRIFSLSYSFMSLDRRFNYVGFAMPLQPFAGFSAGWIYSGVDNIRAYDSRGVDVGEINHGLHALYFSFGVKILSIFQQSGKLTGIPADLITVGISMKYLRETLGDADFSYVGSGLGIDFGVLLQPHPRLKLGYQLKDVSAKLKSNTNNIFERGSVTENKFPIIQKIGAYYQTPLKALHLAYDFERSNTGQIKHHLGMEVRGPGVAGRLGYDDNHFTLGGGLLVHMYRKVNLILDYAFVDDIVDEGVSHVFSWQFIF